MPTLATTNAEYAALIRALAGSYVPVQCPGVRGLLPLEKKEQQ